MAIEGIGNLVLPGTPLHSLLSRNRGKQISVMTVAGAETGLLEDYTSAYIQIVDDGGKSNYILLDRIVSFSFPVGEE